MQKPFEVTTEMLAEVDNEVAQVLKQAPHDAPREVFGTPRIGRRHVGVSDSGSAAQGPKDDQTSAERDSDPVNHPSHYTSHPSGVECITVTEWMSFNLGNAVKYIWRAGMKGYQIEDLKKARWYLEREIARLEG
jgi:uncharacterized protein DUF3310